MLDHTAAARAGHPGNRSQPQLRRESLGSSYDSHGGLSRELGHPDAGRSRQKRFATFFLKFDRCLFPAVFPNRTRENGQTPTCTGENRSAVERRCKIRLALWFLGSAARGVRQWLFNTTSKLQTQAYLALCPIELDRPGLPKTTAPRPSIDCKVLAH